MDNEDFSTLRSIYGQVTGQYTRYMGHVARYVGGIMETPKMVEESGPVFEIVPEAKQKEAVEFLNRQLFTTPSWLISYDIYDRIEDNPITVIGNIQDNILNRLLSTRTMGKLLDAEAAQGSKAYQLTELLGDLRRGIYSEVAARKPIEIYRRNLQKSYVNILSNILNPPRASESITISFGGSSTPSVNVDRSDIKSVVRAHLTQLRNEVRAAAPSITDEMSRYHLLDVANRIEQALDPK